MERPDGTDGVETEVEVKARFAKPDDKVRRSATARAKNPALGLLIVMETD